LKRITKRIMTGLGSTPVTMIRSLIPSWFRVAILVVVACAGSIVVCVGWDLWNLDVGTDATDYVALGMTALLVVGIGLMAIVVDSCCH
jgi:hypothetical protein